MCNPVYIPPQIGALSARERGEIIARDDRRRWTANAAASDDNEIGLRDGSWFRWSYNNRFGSY